MIRQRSGPIAIEVKTLAQRTPAPIVGVFDMEK
jgi:hypothetical protein